MEDWLIRLRKHLGIVPKLGEKIPQVIQPKPLQPDLPLASSSTGTIAGSAERIAVYRQRAANGEALFHPNDNREILIRVRL
jgi:hypothetical protein